MLGFLSEWKDSRVLGFPVKWKLKDSDILILTERQGG